MSIPTLTHNILSKDKLDYSTNNSNLDWTSGNSTTGVNLYISGTKFEEHCFNISGDILDSVFYYFSCTVYYVITFLISIIQKR